MCELFGISSRKPQIINQELKELFSHSNEHPNGWGLALINKGICSIEKEPTRANASRYLKGRLKEPIVVKTALAHIRLATIGHMEWRNCHPFTGTDQSGRQWTLIHNGTIFECESLQKYVSIQNGDTDSERILLFLIDQMNGEINAKGRSLTAEERFKIVDDLVVMLSPENKLNLLICDGELLYAHTNCRDSLHQRVTEESVYFSTKPLAVGVWEPMPFTQLIAYRQGVLKYVGTDHGQEYILDQKSLDFLLLAFSEL